MQNEKRVFLLTGSNIEPRANFLRLAEKEVQLAIGEIIERSSIYESEPWGFDAETPFLNQVLVVRTKLPVLKILKKIQSIEKHLGRVREGKVYLPRTLDIDILYFENETIVSKELMVPHPRLHERKFTLLPLVEVAPDFFHPNFKKANKELLETLQDTGQVWKYVEKSVQE